MSGFQELKEKLSERSEGLDNFGLVLDDDTVVTSFGQPCVASLPRLHLQIGKDRNIKYFMSYHWDKKVDKDVGIRYLRWLKTSSPFKRAFASAAVNKAWKEPITFKTNISAQYMISAHVAVRYMQEYSPRVVFWDMLCSRLTPELSFIMAHYLLHTGNNHVGPAFLAGHSAFSAFSPKGLQRFLDGEKPYSNPEGTVRDKHLEYRGLSYIWNGFEPKDNRLDLHRPVLGQVEIDNGWGKMVREDMTEISNIDKVAVKFLEKNKIKSPEKYILS